MSSCVARLKSDLLTRLLDKGTVQASDSRAYGCSQMAVVGNWSCERVSLGRQLTGTAVWAIKDCRRVVRAAAAATVASVCRTRLHSRFWSTQVATFPCLAAAQADVRTPDGQALGWATGADVEALAWLQDQPTQFLVSTEDGLVAAFDARKGGGAHSLVRWQTLRTKSRKTYNIDGDNMDCIVK